MGTVAGAGAGGFAHAMLLEAGAQGAR